MTLEEFLEKYGSLEDGAHLPEEVVSVAGPLSNFVESSTLKLQYVVFFLRVGICVSCKTGRMLKPYVGGCAC